MSENYDNYSDSSHPQSKKTPDESRLNPPQAKETVVEPNPSKAPPTPFCRKDPKIGKTIGDNNRYLLQTLLGQGGMSQVYQALDTKFEYQVVAIKLMTSYSPATVKHLTKRFMAEIKAISRIKHPNIVQIFDFGVTPNAAPFYGSPFYVMEYFNGKTLQNLLTEKKTVPLDSLSNIIRQVCAGLKEAHQKGIVHRDLKPDNIFLIDAGALGEIVKIIDFGIAKNISCDDNDQNHTKLTQEGSFIGTYRYASPEQCRGLPNIDQKTDIYSLGVILYEAICGKNPYGLDEDFTPSQADWIASHIRVPPKPLKEQPGCENIEDELENIVMKCLAKSPQDRFSDLGKLQDAFANSFSVRTGRNHDSEKATRAERPETEVSLEMNPWNPWNRKTVPEAVLGERRLDLEPGQSNLEVVHDDEQAVSSVFPEGSSAASEDLELNHAPILPPVKKSPLLIGAGIASVLVSIFAGYTYMTHKQSYLQAQGALEKIEAFKAAEKYKECVQQAEKFPKNYSDLQAEVNTLLHQCLQKVQAEEQPQLAEARRLAEQSKFKDAIAENDQQFELKSDKGIDYTQLRKYLEAGKYLEADLETYKVMLMAGKADKEGNPTPESIDNFPCTDLKTINSLWQHYSNRRFGFSIQNNLFQNLGKFPNALGDKVGWLQGNTWIHYNYLWEKFHENVPEGHLPARVFRRVENGTEIWSVSIHIGGILKRANSCNL